MHWFIGGLFTWIVWVSSNVPALSTLPVPWVNKVQTHAHTPDMQTHRSTRTATQLGPWAQPTPCCHSSVSSWKWHGPASVAWWEMTCHRRDRPLQLLIRYGRQGEAVLQEQSLAAPKVHLLPCFLLSGSIVLTDQTRQIFSPRREMCISCHCEHRTINLSLSLWVWMDWSYCFGFLRIATIITLPFIMWLLSLS